MEDECLSPRDESPFTARFVDEEETVDVGISRDDSEIGTPLKPDRRNGGNCFVEAAPLDDSVVSEVGTVERVASGIAEDKNCGENPPDGILAVDTDPTSTSR